MKLKLQIFINSWALLLLFSANIYGQDRTLYSNGDIITMEGDMPQYVETVVAEEGKIIFVGPKQEAMDKYPDAVQVDLNGKTMLPAFLDGHGHFFNVGFTSMAANILPPPDGPGADFNSIIETVRTYQQSEEGKYLTGKLGWIIGNGYDDSQLSENAHPTASDLDKISTEFPILIIHQSGHLGVINSKAMELMGYTSDTPDPKGGVLRRDTNGKPNGVLEENALYNVLFPILGKMDEELEAEAIKKARTNMQKKVI